MWQSKVLAAFHGGLRESVFSDLEMPLHNDTDMSNGSYRRNEARDRFLLLKNGFPRFFDMALKMRLFCCHNR